MSKALDRLKRELEKATEALIGNADILAASVTYAEGLKGDAERYRFLRGYMSLEDIEGWIAMRDMGHEANEEESVRGDAALDAAIASDAKAPINTMQQEVRCPVTLGGGNFEQQCKLSMGHTGSCLLGEVVILPQSSTSAEDSK